MSVMVGLLEVVARLDVLSEEERRRASREEWKRVEEAGWEVVRRAEGVEVKKEKKEEEKKEEKEEEEEEEEVRIGWEEEEKEEEEEVRVGWWKCRGSCGRELELNADMFNRDSKNRTGFFSKCKACCLEKVVVPRGFKVCRGGCGKMLEENAVNFPFSVRSKTGFLRDCKSCYDARYGKKGVPDGHHRCTGKCGQVLKLSEKNFYRSRTRSGFYPKCKSCNNAEQKATRDAARGDKPKKRERPQEDLPDGHQRCLGECSRVLEMSAENFSRKKNTRSGFYSSCRMCVNANRARQAVKKRARAEPEHVVELPRLGELPGYDDEEVISD